MAKKNYDDNSLKQLKGPDQVRLRPGVIFGSDGLDGCCHSVFEILSNSIDEAREGFGKKIIVTRFLDKSIEVQDYGRGSPVMLSIIQRLTQHWMSTGEIPLSYTET